MDTHRVRAHNLVMGTPNLSNWTRLVSVDGEADEAPALCAWDSTRVSALFRRGDGVMRWGGLDLTSGQWSTGPAVGRTRSRPALVRVGERLVALYRGSKSDTLWTSSCDAPWPPTAVGASSSTASNVPGAKTPDGPEPASGAARTSGEVSGVLAALGPRVWRESRTDFNTTAAPALCAAPGGGLLATLPTEHGVAWTVFRGGGWSLPRAIEGLQVREDRLSAALAVRGDEVHLLASSRNHRDAAARAFEVIAPILGTGLTRDVDHVAPHWRWDGAAWSARSTGFAHVVAPNAPGLATVGGRLHAVFRDREGRLGWYFLDGERWSHGGELPARSDEDVTLVCAGRTLVLFTVHDGKLAYCTYRDDPPPNLRARVRVRPR